MSRVLAFVATRDCICGLGRDQHRNADGIWIGCRVLPAQEIRRRLRETLARCTAKRPFGIDAEEARVR